MGLLLQGGGPGGLYRVKRAVITGNTKKSGPRSYDRGPFFAPAKAGWI